MNHCPEPKKIEIAGLDKIPLFKYLKEPALFKGELYERYPQGGEYGWFAFVASLKTFVYWDIVGKDWAVLNLGSENVTQVRYMQIEQELYIMSPKESQKINCMVYDGYNRDFTNQYSQLDVERESGDYYSDQIWNETQGINKGFEFTLTFADLNFRQESTTVRFKVTARRGNSSIVSHIKIG